MIPVPSASKVDYGNPQEICGYQLLLCKIYSREGGFSYPPADNPYIRRIRREGTIWMKEVEEVIGNVLKREERTNRGAVTLGAIPDLLSSYDFFCRICTGKPDFGFLRESRLDMARLWLQGVQGTSSTDVVLELSKEIARDGSSIEKRLAMFTGSTIGDWINELTRCGKFGDASPAEAYSRIKHILSINLATYIGAKDQRQVKSKWAGAYRLDNWATLATPALWKYIGFARTATREGYLPGAADDTQYVRLFTELASRQDLHPFYRQALHLDLSTYA